jgi:NAD(P)-dependent dehydrogenase (short-subunit alcohol dehydrogenase family)
MLVRNTADELGAYGIRVNSVCLGLVVTELSAGLHQADIIRAHYLSCMPIISVGQVEDIANAVRFLCGPASSRVTGTTLPGDGGHHLRRVPNILAGLT